MILCNKLHLVWLVTWTSSWHAWIMVAITCESAPCSRIGQDVIPVFPMNWLAFLKPKSKRVSEDNIKVVEPMPYQGHHRAGEVRDAMTKFHNMRPGWCNVWLVSYCVCFRAPTHASDTDLRDVLWTSSNILVAVRILKRQSTDVQVFWLESSGRHVTVYILKLVSTPCTAFDGIKVS